VTDDAIRRVALADKVHNARSIVRDYREEGHRLWERFTQKTAREQLWYYGGLLAFFEQRRPGPLTEDLWRAVGELAWLVARDDAQRLRWIANRLVGSDRYVAVGSNLSHAIQVVGRNRLFDELQIISPDGA